MSDSKQIKLGALLSYATIAFNIIAGLIYTPWMVRQIGKSDYGLYVLVTSFLTYFVMDFGLGQALARFVAKYRAEGNESKVAGLFGLTVKLYMILDLLFLTVLFIVYLFIEKIFTKLTAVELSRFKIAFCIAGLFSLISFPFTPLNGILIAYERFVLLKICDLLNKMGIIILMVIALLMGYKLYALIAINALVGIVIIVIKLIYSKRAYLVNINLKNGSGELFGQLASFSFWISVFKIAQLLLINITPLILGIWSGTVQIAIFSIGMIIQSYTSTIANALNGLFLPRVSELVESNEKVKEISRLMIRVGRIQLFIIGPVLIGIVTLGKEFIVLWMGRDFVSSYYVALLLIIPSIIILTQEIGITFLLVINKIKIGALLLVAASMLSVLISAILAPKYGAIGSAAGIFTALVFGHILGMNIVYWKALKIDMLAFFRECHIQMLVPLGLSISAGFIIQLLLPAHSLLSFLPKVGLFGFVYLVLMWTLGLNSAEKKMILSLSGKMRFG